MQPAALILIDLQEAIDDPSWGVRNNPQAETIARALLEKWRGLSAPLFHIRHDSTEPQSTYRPGQPGNSFKPEVAPLAGECVIVKHVHSAFVGTDLESRLRTAGIDHLVVCGVITNNSVEATVRHGANLGFQITLVEDACFTFGRADYHGHPRTADEVHSMSLANLQGEYCQIVHSRELL
ncbi:MAG: cysteine hydrolase family protein [Acidobacteriota bacterium]